MNDKVLVHYHGTLTNGEFFSSSTTRGEPMEFALTSLFKGLVEGLMLMSPRDKIELVIPSELALGRLSRPGIPANSVLIYETELLEINPQ
jgi:FKBP-type peptidyl-prolyl cis-trans isomerase